MGNKGIQAGLRVNASFLQQFFFSVAFIVSCTVTRRLNGFLTLVILRARNVSIKYSNLPVDKHVFSYISSMTRQVVCVGEEGICHHFIFFSYILTFSGFLQRYRPAFTLSVSLNALSVGNGIWRFLFFMTAWHYHLQCLTHIFSPCSKRAAACKCTFDGPTQNTFSANYIK